MPTLGRIHNITGELIPASRVGNDRPAAGTTSPSKRNRDDDGDGCSDGVRVYGVNGEEERDSDGRIAKKARIQDVSKAKSDTGLKGDQPCTSSSGSGISGASNGIKKDGDACDSNHQATATTTTSKGQHSIATTKKKKKKRSKKKEKKDPNAPKGVPSQYIFYQNEIRPKISKELPSLSFGEVTSVIGQRWKALTAEQKKPYEDLRDEDRKRYEREMEVYKASLGVAKRAVDDGLNAVVQRCATQPSVTVPIIISTTEDQTDSKPTGVKSNASKKSSADGEEDTNDGDVKQCAICHELIHIFEKDNDAETCYGPRGCGAVIHKRCLKKYKLDSLSKCCIKCCALEPEEGGAKTLAGMSFVVDTKRDKDEKTIKAFGGTWSRNIPPGRATWFVVNKNQRRSKVNEAEKRNIPLIGPANIRLLALGKMTVDQVKRLPKILVDCAESPVPPTHIRKSVGDVGLSTEKKSSFSEGDVPEIVPRDSMPKEAAEMGDSVTNDLAGTASNSSVAVASSGIGGTKTLDSSKLASLANACAAAQESMNGGGKENQVNASPRKGDGSNYGIKKGSSGGLRKRKMSSKSNGGSLTKQKLSSMKSSNPKSDNIQASMEAMKVSEAIAPEDCMKSNDEADGDSHKAPEGRSLNEEDLEVSKLECATMEVESEGQVSPPPGNGSASECGHSDETPVTANGSTKMINKNQPLVESCVVGSNASTSTSSSTLKLVPISKPDCRAIFHEKGVSYSEPEYLCKEDEGRDEYNVTRDTITLEMVWKEQASSTGVQNVSGESQHPTRVVLGRNRNTPGVKWSAISRRLCDISLARDPHTPIPTAFLKMMKSADEHAACLNGRDLNEPVGKRVPLKNGDILSLYGPCGFAYRVEIPRDGGEPLDPIKLFP